MPKRLEAPQMRRSHCVITSSPPPTHTPWIMATIGCRHRAIAPIVASSAAPYFFASLAFLRVVSNSDMSAPAAKALAPAPRLTMQRRDWSASSSPIASPSRVHEPRPSALSLSGLLSVTAAISPRRARRISPDMIFSLCRFPDESAPHAGEGGADERPEEQHERERGDRADQAVRPEHAPVPARADHRQAKRILGAAAEHERERERRERDADLLEYVADDAEEKHQPYVEHGVLYRVGADRAGRPAHRRDRRERHAQDGGEERHRGEHEDEADHVAEIHRGDQSPDEALVLDEQERPRVQAPQRQAAEQDRRRARARDAESEHRQERGSAGGVRRRLRSEHAFDAALAEGLLILGETLGEVVAHEGGGDRAPRSDAEPAADRRRTQQRHPVARHFLPHLEHRAQADAGGVAAQREPLLHRQQDLADAEQADHRDQEVDAAQEIARAEGHAQLPGDRLHADARDREPQRQ